MIKYFPTMSEALASVPSTQGRMGEGQAEKCGNQEKSP